MKKDEFKTLANFVYEIGVLNDTPRSGLWFLGTGKQSVSEHILRTIYIGYILAHLEPKADKEKVIYFCMIHDLGESRTSDLNYIHQRYGRLAEDKAVKDIAQSLPFGNEIQTAFKEIKKKQTLEAKIAKDADTLEWMATLRAEETRGNKKAKSWIRIASKRLETKSGEKLGRYLISTNPDAWWFDESDKWFVNREAKDKKWRNK